MSILQKVNHKVTVLGSLFMMVTAGVAAKKNNEKPNIIVILSDDIGFSDIGCYGGEAKTPNLDKLANNGVRFGQFYNGARCCPTRASILTGVYAHQAGVGYMSGKMGDTKAYQGYLREDRRTIGEYMKEVGYSTYQVGKWHVGNERNGAVPHNRGFDKSWVRIKKVNYWKIGQVLEDGVLRKTNPAEEKYLTDVEGDKAIGYINEAAKKDNPFFMYLAFDAAHWPLHAKKEDIAKYRHKFLKGWDELRKERIERIDSIGLVKSIDPEMIEDKQVPLWSSLPEGDGSNGYLPSKSKKQDKDDWDLKMAIYAAQIDCMDQNIGRIIAKLKEEGLFDNTIIMFLQDNGACPETIGGKETVVPGGPDSYASYNLPWAYLGNTPFKMYKHFVYEGGISTSFIFHWPKGVTKKRVGAIENESFGHIIDIVPTCLEAAGANLNDYEDELEGQSLISEINGKKENNDRLVFWEHEGNRAIRKGDWKLVSRWEQDVTYFEKWGYDKTPRTQEWELFNVKEDRWELNEVAARHPELVEELKQTYQNWYNRVGAIPRSELLKKGGKGKKH